MKNFNLKKSFLESSFLRVINIIKKNPQIYLYTITLDFIFLALVIFLGKYLGSFIPADPQQLFGFFKTTTNLLLFAIIYPVVYYLFIILIYSTIKLSILKLISQSCQKSKFSFKGIWKFYKLNILVFLDFLLIAVILATFLFLILDRTFLTYVALVLSIPFLFFIYSILNIGHTLFIKEEKKLIKTSFKIAFKRINKYGMFIVWDAFLILLYLLFYNLIHLLFRVLIFSNQELLAKFGSVYLTTFNIISIIFVYMVLAFNRIYFFERINKNVLQ